MIADDLQQHATATINYGCDTCRHNHTELVTVPHSVIMDAVATEDSPVTGERLAERLARDPRITATDDRNPDPHAPSSRWNGYRLLQLATNLRNQRLIPFSPFAPNIDGDGLRDRDEYRQWRARYLADLPTDSLLWGELDSPRVSAGTDDPVTGVDAPADGSMVDLGQMPNRRGQLDVVRTITGLQADDDDGDDDDPVDVIEAARALIDQVPDTPYQAVIDWVGDDQTRAMAAYLVEVDRPLGRRVSVDRHVAGVLGDLI